MTLPVVNHADANVGGAGSAAANIPDPGVLAATEQAFVAVCVSSSNTVTTPSGWVLVAGPLTTTAGSTDQRTYVFRHLGDPSTWSFPLGSSGPYAAAMVTVLGADTSLPVDTTSQALASAAGATLNNSGLTTTGPDRLLLHFSTARAGATNTWTPPSGYVDEAQDSNASHSAQVASDSQAAAGATGTVTATGSVASTRIVSFLIAVRGPQELANAPVEVALTPVPQSLTTSSVTPSAPPAIERTNRVMIFVRDVDGSIIGQIDHFTLLDFRSRFNDVGAWNLEMPAFIEGVRNAQSSLLTPGRGIIVVLDGEVFGSGQLTEPTTELLGSLIAEGVDDNDILLGTLAYPAAPSLVTSGQAYDVRSGASETVATAYVDANCGGSADIDRYRLLTRASGGRGSSVSESARFETVLDVVKRVLAVDGYGFQVKADLSDPGPPYFEVIVPRDQSAQVEFSTFRGTIGLPSSRTDRRPAATTAVVGGGEEGTLRVFRTATNPAQEAIWGRREVFVDARDSTDTAVLDNRGAAEVQAVGPILEIAALETVGTRYGDWRLGDWVTGQLLGVAESLLVTEVRLLVTGDSAVPKLRPTLTPSALVLADRVSLLQDRVRALESRT